MRRTVIAAAWLIGATLPVAAAVVFLVGCCVLPFHGLIHRVMPICHMAAHILQGDDGDHKQGSQAPSVPAREKQEPVKRMASTLPQSVCVAQAVTTIRAVISTDATGYRSFITLGALRCDQDVGLQPLLTTFRI